MTAVKSSRAVAEEFEDLRKRLGEAEETLRAIRSGEVDGVVVNDAQGDQLYSLEGAEHPYRLFFESMNEGTLIVAEDGLVLFSNRRFAGMLNASVETIIGQKIDAIPIPEVRACLSTLLATRGACCDPRELTVAVDGHVRTLKFEANRLSQDAGLAILVTDVTDDRARLAALAIRSKEEHESRLAALNMMEDAVSAAHALERANRDLTQEISARRTSEEANRRLATVVEQASELIVITDTRGVIEYVNPAFERITGYSRAEALGQTPRLLKSGKQDAAFYKKLWSTITAGGVWHGTFRNCRKDGSLFDEEATISPVRDREGTITNFVGIKRDVTSEKALEEQLRHSQKIEAIGTLAGGIAHDFNNLLQAMLSIVQLLKRKKVDPARLLGHLDLLEKTVRRGSGLTRQLLLFARRGISQRHTLDLNEILRDLTLFLGRVVRANIRLRIEPASAPLWINADRGQIEQVVMNLAVNAIDAMSAGGVLSVSASRDEHAAYLEVSDTGPGIPETIRHRIFEPFFTTKEAGKGTGLGLSVVYGIIDGHGGRIDVQCPAAGGTTFRIELPLQNAAAAAMTATPPAEDVPNGHGERVRLVEDDEAARESVSGILEVLGYTVVAVGAGEEAVAIDKQVTFAVLLTDSMLPGMPGMEVVRRLRERQPDIKAILMSGYATPGVIDVAVAANEFHFLQKPFELADLARTLRTVLESSDDPKRP